MTSRLRAAVIGCGIGAWHAAAYARDPDVQLVAACDLNPAAFGRFYERAQLPSGALREYTDYRLMLEQERPDLVSVVTPDDHHAAPVIAAAESGVKGIICEKPLAGSLADADRMIEAVERSGTALLVDHTRCLEPHHLEARARVRDGYIGDLTRIVATLGGARAMLFRNTTHLLGSVCFFAEADPLWVIAALDRGFEDYGTVYKGQGGRDPALDPGATLIVEFANGVRALVVASKGTPQIGVEVDLLGTRGRLLVKERETQAWQCQTAQGRPEPQTVTWAQGLSGADLGERLTPAVAQLVRLVRGEEPGPGSSPPRAARNVLEILLGALQSQARGMVPVRLPLPR